MCIFLEHMSCSNMRKGDTSSSFALCPFNPKAYRVTASVIFCNIVFIIFLLPFQVSRVLYTCRDVVLYTRRSVTCCASSMSLGIVYLCSVIICPAMLLFHFYRIIWLIFCIRLFKLNICSLCHLA